MKKIIFTLLIIVATTELFAGFVQKIDAKKVAKNYYYQSVNNIKKVSWEDVKLNCIYDPTENAEYNFYIFNINTNEGFVIISSDDNIQPILAYSLEEGFNSSSMHPGQSELLQYYQECIELASKYKIDPSSKNENLWNELKNDNSEDILKQKTTSPNLLTNINWNQDWPYNSQCPEDVDGINGHVPVGCIATAMLQVMKYYNWPPNGEGSKEHLNYVNGGYGDINIDFSLQTYDWNSIPNEASSYVNEELGKINFHAAVGVSMYWSPEGSGSNMYNIVDALENYFIYSTSAQHVTKSDYIEVDWKNLIKAQINANKPVVYAGNPTTTAGHAWNCDGYQDDYFHMNWGWGGAGNGYYTLDNLISTGTIGGPEDNFNLDQQMIIDIYPAGSYPIYCSGTTTINSYEGSFGDGSSILSYGENQMCKYIIEPNSDTICISSIEIDFDFFELALGDTLFIYDGNTELFPLIGSYTEQNNPIGNSIYGTNQALTIIFKTDDTNNSQGWNLDYSVITSPLPTVYNLTSSTNNYCSGSEGGEIVLDGSETGITYELYDGGSGTGITIQGTGSAITFIGIAAGEYTILATNDVAGCIETMSGNETVLEVPTYEFTTTESMCDGDSIEWRGNWYDAIGIYTDSYSSEYGCDSIYRLDLILYPLQPLVTILSNPSNGIIEPGNTGEISLSTSYTETDYWVTMGAANFTEEIAGNDSGLSLGTNFPAGTFDIWSRNEHGCEILQGSATFVEDNGNNNLTANVTYGTSATNFPSGEAIVSLHSVCKKTHKLL